MNDKKIAYKKRLVIIKKSGNKISLCIMDELGNEFIRFNSSDYDALNKLKLKIGGEVLIHKGMGTFVKESGTAGIFPIKTIANNTTLFEVIKY